MPNFRTQVAEEPGKRIAAVAFGIYLVVALAILVRLGSHYWFVGDELAFFVGSISDPAVLFRPIHTHWSTLPILVYRALYSVFGLHSYLPYQLCVILVHLTLCCLVRAIMRRSGVGPWMATISTAPFVLFGWSELNILAGVQVSQVGSIVLGFSALLLADHDGRIDWRDCLGVLCGLGSIMSSSMGPPMVAIVGLAVVCRRGWRPAMFHTLPLAAIYVIWFTLNHTDVSMVEQVYPPPGYFLRWVARGESGVFLALGGGYTVVAVGLGALLVIGLALAWSPLDLSALRRRAALPAAMFIGALALLAVICTQRGWAGLGGARGGHYIGICTALTLPALAVGADAVVRRWQWMMPVVCSFFLVGLVVGATKFNDTILTTPQAFENTRAILLAAAYSPLAEQVPADLRPEPNLFIGAEVDMGFLLAARDSGRLPPPPVMTPALESQTNLRLSVQQLLEPIPENLTCSEYTESIELNPKVGDLFGITTPLLISLGESGAPLGYYAKASAFPVIRILRPDLKLHLAPQPPATSFGFCM
jgi:hypothetical protein